MEKPQNRAFRIGLTGGIASGKSLVADRFAEHGVPIIDTDEIARQVVEPGRPGWYAIRTRFGAAVFDSDRRLDRRHLRELVFDDPDARHDLEAALHPLIRARTLEIADRANGPYQVLVVPLMVETGFDALVDRVLVIDCPESVQRSRLLARDDEAPDRIERMLAAQADRQARLSRADDVIDNTGTAEQTRARVDALHERYLQLARAALICGHAPGSAE